jgi:hypothetical protein
MANNDIISIEGKNIRETFEAVYGDFGDIKEWIPKSQMEDWPDVGEEGLFEMEEWIAYEKELI